ncbi:MAG: hypothetical protein AB8F94_18165 [Saprospiraceae bacterium]
MKNEILDENIVDALHKELNKGEKIIWEGHPQRSIDFNISRGDALISSWLTRLLLIFLFGWLFYIMFLFAFGIPFLPFVFLFVLLAFAPNIYLIVQRKKTKYIISNQRVIFNLWEQGITNVYSIYYSEINGAVVNRETEKDGVIHLAIKIPQRIRFDTYNLGTGDKRHQPTLEMIENVEEVASYIRSGIQENLQISDDEK